MSMKKVLCVLMPLTTLSSSLVLLLELILEATSQP